MEENKLDYNGELTLEALSVLDTYVKSCCNTNATSKKLNKQYLRVRYYLKQPYVREFFKLNLLRKGITPERIAGVVDEGLNAKDKDGNDDWMARHRFTQLACEIFEVLKYQAKVDILNQSNNLFITNIKQAIENAYTNSGAGTSEGSESSRLLEE